MDRPDIDTLVIPVGGGGLIAGCAIAAKNLNPAIEIVGVEAEMYPSMRDAVFGGTDRRTGGYSIADGISVKSPAEQTLPVVKDYVARIEIVHEDEIENAIHTLAEIEKQVVEGAGAVALAAVLSNRDPFTGKRTALIISGGNIVEVQHERWYRDIPVRLAQIEVLLEVRNGNDGHTIAEGPADRGFPARILGTDYGAT